MEASSTVSPTGTVLHSESRSLYTRKAKAAYLAGEDISAEQTEWLEALFHQEYEDRHEIHGQWTT